MEDPIAFATRHVRQSAARIERLRSLAARLERDGAPEDSRRVRALLAVFLDIHGWMEVHLAALPRHVAPAPPAPVPALAVAPPAVPPIGRRATGIRAHRARAPGRAQGRAAIRDRRC